MTDFAYVADSLDESAEFKVDKVQFGDGFSQRIPSGINNGLRRWSVTFTDRSQAEADAIVAFFVGKRGSTSFTWMPQGFTSDLRVICPTYSRPIQNRWKNGAWTYTVNCTFEEVAL